MNFEVLQGDCLAEMAKLPPYSVDACITDPPYGTTACSWDSVIPFAPMWAELKRIVKPKGAIVLFGSQPFTSALVMSNPQMFRYQWIWEKISVGNPQLAKIQPLKEYEDVCVFSAEAHGYFPQGLIDCEIHRTKDTSTLGHCKRKDYTQTQTNYPRSLLRYSAERGLHPTQKPVDLLRYLVRTYTNAGDTVLDFTCGSGTTGVACAIEGRNSINIEQDAGYCEIARARIMRASGIACDIPKRARPETPLPLFEACA